MSHLIFIDPVTQPRADGIRPTDACEEGQTVVQIAVYEEILVPGTGLDVDIATLVLSEAKMF